MSIRLRIFSFAGTVIVFSLLALSSSTSAQSVQDFTIRSFHADFELTNDDPQGSLLVTEVIELDFQGENRGILRALPQSFDDIDTRPEIVQISRNGQAEPFITYEEQGNLVAKIGDEAVFVTGSHVYMIEYQVENVVRFFDTHDELFWDINGDQWLQPFESVSVEIASIARLTEPKAQCFTGSFGSDQSECSVKQNTESLEIATTQRLEPGETLTIVAAYEKGFFTPMSFVERNRGQLSAVPLAAVLSFVVASAHRKWRAHGKDHSKRGLVAPFFGRPRGLSVMQAGYVAENKLTPKHMSASIIDLAIRGYITITERGEGRKVTHEIALKKKFDSHMSVDERELLEALVGTKVGETVELESKKNKLHKTHQSLKKMIDARTTEKGFYDLSPKKAEKSLLPQLALAAIGLVVGLSLAEYSKGVTVVVGVVALALVIGYRAFMPKRSKQGDRLVEHMEGLKLYIDTAEKDRIEKQDAVAAPLSHNARQPVRDVAFFEKLLPFAVALGVEKSWASAFSGIYTQPPEWYSGNWNTFSTAHLASSIASTSKAASQSFSAPSSSGGSGFSGGFSGGGGGGGGGGGW